MDPIKDTAPVTLSTTPQLPVEICYSTFSESVGAPMVELKETLTVAVTAKGALNLVVNKEESSEHARDSSYIP